MLKPKEFIVDFMKKVEDAPITVIHGQKVESVPEYKYIGTIFNDKFRWMQTRVQLSRNANNDCTSYGS